MGLIYKLTGKLPNTKEEIADYVLRAPERALEEIGFFTYTASRGMGEYKEGFISACRIGDGTGRTIQKTFDMVMTHSSIPVFTKCYEKSFEEYQEEIEAYFNSQGLTDVTYYREPREPQKR